MDKSKMDVYRKKTEEMLDQLFAKSDISPQEFKNANEAVCFLEKLDKIERGEAMREEYGDNYGTYYPNMPYGTSSWVASGPYPDPSYGDNYGRRMRSSTTGRYMNGSNSGQTYGHSIPDRMVSQLEDMMDQAHNDYERQMIQKEIQNIRSNNMI